MMPDTCCGKDDGLCFVPPLKLISQKAPNGESLFIAWRLTHDSRYRKYAWDIFTAIQKYCRLKNGGYATVRDVDTVPVSLEDKQETFFMVRSWLIVGCLTHACVW